MDTSTLSIPSIKTVLRFVETRGSGNNSMAPPEYNVYVDSTDDTLEDNKARYIKHMRAMNCACREFLQDKAVGSRLINRDWANFDVPSSTQTMADFMVAKCGWVMMRGNCVLVK